MWEPERAGGASTAQGGHSSRAYCAAISADGYWIAVGYHDGAICIWDAQSGRAVGGRLEGHTTRVTDVAFSPDGGLLASGSWDKTVRLWNVHTRAAVGSALEGHKSAINKILFSADGTKLLSYPRWNKYRCLWGVPSGTLLWMSHRSSEDIANVMSDADAQTAVEAIESQSRLDASRETAAVYYDWKESAVMMKRSKGDVRLAPLPPLLMFDYEYVWMHIADRSEFITVLRDGRPVCLTLHV